MESDAVAPLFKKLKFRQVLNFMGILTSSFVDRCQCDSSSGFGQRLSYNGVAPLGDSHKEIHEFARVGAQLVALLRPCFLPDAHLAID